MNRMSLRALALAALAGLLPLMAAPALAQVSGEAFQGFSSNSGDPINIEADRLEVRDAEKVAVYSGNVRIQQGATVLKAPRLTVHYTGNAANGAPGSAVDRIEAGSPVFVQSGDQTATGTNAVFEMQRDLITLTGDVVLTQGGNVVRGNRLVVNLKTKKANIQGGRVQTILTPTSRGAANQ